VVSSYVGWMVYLLSVMYEEHDLAAQRPALARRYKAGILAIFTLTAVIIFTCLYGRHLNTSILPFLYMVKSFVFVKHLILCIDLHRAFHEFKILTKYLFT